MAALEPANEQSAYSSSWEGWQRYLLLYVLATLLLLGVGWTALSAGRELRDTLGDVGQLQTATKQLAALMSQIVDLESSERSFLLTGDEKYLEPYYAAERTISEQFAQIDAALEKYPAAREELSAIQTALTAKRSEVAATLAIYREQGPEAALTVVRSALARHVMDDTRAAVAKLSLDALGVIADKQANLERFISARNLTIFIALGLTIAASLAGMLLLRRHLTSLRMQEHLRVDFARSERASKEKSTFLANMSHEIRTPMNAIFGFSQLLAERVTDAQDKRYVDAIVTSGRALLALINDVLDLSKIEAGKLEVHPAPMSLRETLDVVTSVFSQLAMEKGLRLTMTIDASLPDGVELDQTRLRQMLFNLVGNAVKYTDYGNIIVRASATVDPEDETRATCMIEVEDTGIGIATADRERIFDPFTQANPDTDQREGTGLGLSITRRIARLMGGEISMDSQPGMGSCFRIHLPKVALALPPTISPSGAGELDLLQAATILVVDDIELNRQLIEAMLAGSPHRLVMASDGAEAVALAELHKPAMVLMDIRMPGMDGLTALKHIRADTSLRATRIVAVTASSLHGEESQLREHFDGYIRKPITRELLYAELNRLMPHVDARANAAPLQHPDHLVAVLQALQALERDTLPELQASLAVHGIARLTEQLLALAERCGSASLRAYARRLHHAAAQFDPIALQTTLAEFPSQRAGLAAQLPDAA